MHYCTFFFFPYLIWLANKKAHYPLCWINLSQRKFLCIYFVFFSLVWSEFNFISHTVKQMKTDEVLIPQNFPERDKKCHKHTAYTTQSHRNSHFNYYYSMFCFQNKFVFVHIEKWEVTFHSIIMVRLWVKQTKIMANCRLHSKHQEKFVCLTKFYGYFSGIIF